VKCPCGREIRPCNFERHFRAQHLPHVVPNGYALGHSIEPARIPVDLKNGSRRRYDAAIPRGMGLHRFRIYRLQGERDLVPVGTAPSDSALGRTLVYLSGRGAFADGRPGVLDTLDDPGKWVVNPWEG
jgi:hypothetical protein